MHALTLWRPWSDAIIHGPKRIENRQWPAPPWLVGQRFALHAGARWDGEALAAVCGTWTPNPIWTPPAEHESPLGIVGVATLVDVHDVEACPAPVAGECGICSDPWTFGRFAWVLAGVKPLLRPVPCRGHQKLWPLPPDVEHDVLAQLRVIERRAAP